jgi:hypothetical protein
MREMYYPGYGKPYCAFSVGILRLPFTPPDHAGVTIGHDGVTIGVANSSNSVLVPTSFPGAYMQYFE